MESLCLFDPGGNSCWDGSHGEDHGGELLVQPKRELVNEGDFVSNPCSSREILEVGDILLESVVHDPIRAFKRFLGEFSEFEAVVALVSKGKKVELKFLMNLLKVFLILAIVVLAILSYHISEKGIPLSLLILLSAVVIFHSSVL